MNRRRSRIALAGAAVVVVAMGGAAAYGFEVGGEEPVAASTLPPSTATVTRMTLTETEDVTGTLSYGEAKVVGARGGGTLTWLPADGSIVERGRAVYRTDDAPVVLLYGALPLYRVLRSGTDGKDVEQVERNLAELGYDGFTVDESYTSATADAVREWQSDLGVDATGTVEPSRVVIASGPIRVADSKASVGDPASGPVLGYTGTTRVVEIALDVAKQHLVRKGTTATVTLPDETEVTGEVSRVGTVATTATASGQGQTTTTIDVVVSIKDQKALGTLDGAPVSVTLRSDTRENVLAAPVAALVALAEGGYGVEVIANGTSSYVAVTTGLFADGRVEISGDGIAEGTVVGMPS
jgi:peptidoglycan hydrolase-like protein with peptidoglycan-binding domain